MRASRTGAAGETSDTPGDPAGVRNHGDSDRVARRVQPSVFADHDASPLWMGESLPIDVEPLRLHVGAGRGCRWIPARQVITIRVRQRKETGSVGRKELGATRRRTAAHQSRRVRIVWQSQRMAELMSDDVAQHVGHRQGLDVGVPDSNELAIADARAE